MGFSRGDWLVAFNPCCIGLGIQTSRLRNLHASFKLFQSLLYWIGYSNGFMRCASSSDIRFNPCCIGLGIQTIAQKPPGLFRDWFQSLLYWIGYSNPHHHDRCAALRLVSILVVLDWVFKRRARAHRGVRP